MPKVKLTERLIRQQVAEASGDVTLWDTTVHRFGVRFQGSAGRYVLKYVNAEGRQTKHTLGSVQALKLDEARRLARSHLGDVDKGLDPHGERLERRRGKTFDDLATEYMDRHARPHKRPSSQMNDGTLLRKHLLPTLRNRKVASITRNDLQKLHAKLTDKPYQANRMLALVRKMFNLAIAWGYRTDNPATGIQRYTEDPRERWLSVEELGRLSAVLDRWPDQRQANVIRLLLLTGARRNEVLHMRWDQLDLDRGTWTKRASEVKQKRLHHLPLGAAPLNILRQMKNETVEELEWVFPGRRLNKPLQESKGFWARMCEQAEITNCRLHDLRHSFASHLVSNGESLAIVGKLLGHSRAETTRRYAHLADPSLRAATAKFSEVTGFK